jgi:hypothetical protein
VILADYIVIEVGGDLHRLGKLRETDLGSGGKLLFDDLVAKVDAFVADIDAGPGDELFDLLLGLATKTALEQIHPVAELRHQPS